MSIIESKKTRARVARVDGTNSGFLVYRPFRHKLLLQGLGVTPSQRRKGVGRALFQTIYDDLERNNKLYNRIVVPVLERELVAQLFLKSMGLLAIGIMRAENHTEDDSFVFRYKVNRPVKRYSITRKAKAKS